ncbi:PREDICTED: uncharacterized protein LOC105453499 isoform X3 [Wasmannia auropunctata]|uniref:uncharacterized protein LOC105453499 isoform X3 n=1 Tax=Wasmannia auropunctata TaxID=64793 RepID=UPI0005EEC911|nr:PREDICTED: uncharacterized protein LOC105453499 isoform X3 [Wasmannia auropunctata]
MSAGSEDVELENVLRQIFVECDADASISTPDSTAVQLTGDAVPISRIVEYIQDRLPAWSIDNLEELWRCLAAVSTNDHVNLRQFKEATKRWIAQVQQQVQSAQDGSNNNVREKLHLASDADSSMKTMEVANDIVELELRNVKFRELCEENNVLRDELERHERSIDKLKQQHSIVERQLKHYAQRCQQLEKENDEQRDQLNELFKKEKTMASALQRYTKEHENLSKQLEAAEIEVQAIPSLKEELEKVIKEKMDCLRRIAKMQEEFDEKESNCSQLKITITELEDTSLSMKESYEYTIRNLREKNRLLTDENVELQSLSAFNACSSLGEMLSMSPVLDIDGFCSASTPCKSIKVPEQDSLYTELKALGFTAECNRNDTQELEEELREYDDAMFTISEQLEKVVQFFVTVRGSAVDLPHVNPRETDARTFNVNVLKHKASLLLNMATEEITRWSTRQDSSTQLRAEPADAQIASSLDQFGVRSFRDLLATHAIRPKAEAGLRVSIVSSHCVNNEDDDSFSRVVKTCTPGAQSRFRIIEPIIEELHDIIESTLGALVDHKDRPLSGNSRYRSIHTLPSLTAEDSKCPTFGCQSPEANTIATAAPLARGDGPTQEDRDEKSAPLAAEARDVSDRENPARTRGDSQEEDQSNEMSKTSSVLQTDSKASAASDEEEASAGSFQVPGASGASTTNLRRKISVYCRSFDVVEVQNPREDHPGSSLEVRQSSGNPDGSPAQIDRFTTTGDRSINADVKYTFNHVYRNEKSDSDSANSTPGKQFQDSLLDDEPPIEQSIPRKVHLAPTRLKFPQEARNELDRTANASCASPIPMISTELDISNSSSYPANGHEKDHDAPVHSSLITDKRKTKSVVFGSTSYLDTNVSQAHSVPNCCLLPRDQDDSAKIVDSEDPHSQSCVRRVGGESLSRIERSVDSQMSSREDSLAAVSGSDEREPTAGSGDRCGGIDERAIANGIGKAAVNVVSSPSIETSVSAKVVPCENAEQSGEKAREGKNQVETKGEIQQFPLSTKRSYSEGENLGRSECQCKNAPSVPHDSQCRVVFPSLAEICPQESGIANLSDSELEIRENPSELELQKKYTAFSLCLSIDRLTLPRRTAMSIRQRDQSERNLSYEVRKMQQDIQELAPLCTDRESVERVERVRHQLDMIVRCAHRVSCAAETLGAVQQERRVSRAVLLADKYLHLLQSRCEKLFANVAETKRILVENNIVIEENSGELNDELPRIRYRSGTPANNRMMMARRRASVATMSRPMGSTQDVTKDAVRQRNSVSGRMTLRRPSFSSESPKWDIEKLDRTESSNSISELRGIFEQVESRRSSKEENNNMLRLNHSNSQSIVNCAIIDNEVWTNVKEESSPEVSDNESLNSERSSARSSNSFQSRRRKRRRISMWHIMLSSILIFCFVFYVIQAMSLNICHEPLNKRLIGYVFDRYGQIRNPM